MKTALRRHLNNALHDGIPSYGDSVPLTKIFQFCLTVGFLPIDEDGEPWSGLLCGREGSASIALRDVSSGEVQKECLQIQWWIEDNRRPESRVETNCYVL